MDCGAIILIQHLQTTYNYWYEATPIKMSSRLYGYHVQVGRCESTDSIPQQKYKTRGRIVSYEELGVNLERRMLDVTTCEVVKSDIQ